MESKIAGCLYGMAIGDALAAPVEFIRDVASIESYYSRYEFGGGTRTLVVTDDTQMALAVGEALMAAPRPYTAATVEPTLRREFVAWMNSPENNRAPGMTCMSACRRLGEGLPWEESTVVNSKGCGANMRVHPVGLLFGETAETRAALAQFQAALTHGHTTGLSASDLTAWTIHDLATGGDPATITRRLIEYAKEQRNVYHRDWLGRLWQHGGYETAGTFISQGWDECLRSLAQLQTAVEKGDRASDPCESTGDGWIAEEAFATGLLAFLLFVDDPVAALRRASVTRGDSDSIACFAGAFIGAYHGIDAFPVEWRERIEYRDRLDALAAFLSKAAVAAGP